MFLKVIAKKKLTDKKFALIIMICFSNVQDK